MRCIRKCRASFAVLSGGSEKLRWRTPADPGCRTRAVARGHEQGRTRCAGPEAMAALPRCPAVRTTASPASGRAAVQPGDLLYPIGVCDEVLCVLGRMRVQQIIPVSEDRALLQETVAQHGPWRSWPRPAPSRSSWPASREPISRSMARCRRDLAAPDLPAEAGRPVRHVSEDGRLLHSIGEPCIYRLAESSAADLQAILGGPPGEPIPQYQARKPKATPAGTVLSSDHEPGSTTASRHDRTDVDVGAMTIRAGALSATYAVMTR
jgi:hypothetical protein